MPLQEAQPAGRSPVERVLGQLRGHPLLKRFSGISDFYESCRDSSINVWFKTIGVLNFELGSLNSTCSTVSLECPRLNGHPGHICTVSSSVVPGGPSLYELAAQADLLEHVTLTYSTVHSNMIYNIMVQGNILMQYGNLL